MSLPLPPGLKLIRGVWKRWLGPKADLELEILHYEAGRRFAADSKRAPNPGPSSQFGALLCSFPPSNTSFHTLPAFPGGRLPQPPGRLPQLPAIRRFSTRKEESWNRGERTCAGAQWGAEEGPARSSRKQRRLPGAALGLFCCCCCCFSFALKKRKKKTRTTKKWLCKGQGGKWQTTAFPAQSRVLFALGFPRGFRCGLLTLLGAFVWSRNEGEANPGGAADPQAGVSTLRRERVQTRGPWQRM